MRFPAPVVHSEVITAPPARIRSRNAARCVFVVPLILLLICAWDIYEALPIESRYKYIQELNANGEQLLVNYELMDLMTFCDDAIGQDNIVDIERVINEYRN